MSVFRKSAKPAFRPLGDRVLVRPEKGAADEVTPSGVIAKLAAHAEAPARGVVVAVGPGRVTDQGQRVPVEVAVGEVVSYGKFAGSTIEVEGEDLLMLREADLWGVVG